MQQIVEYQLIRVSDDESLTKAINEAIRDGWQPFGSPSAYDDDHARTILMQAVVRYFKPVKVSG